MITQPVKTESESPSYLDLKDGRRLAYRLSEGSLPGVVFLGGFNSDMSGNKATALEEFCREEGIRFLRFDYSGHGLSSGKLMAGTIGGWKQDTLDMIECIAHGPNILVGSSMGAWLMMLAALERPKNILGLVGIASAPDFTETLIWDKFSDAQKKTMKDEGVIYLPACDGAKPYPISWQLIKEGRKHLLLKKRKIGIDVPVRLIHGARDEDVPWKMAVELMERLQSRDTSLELVKDGGHRLSFPAHILLMYRTVTEVLSLAQNSFASGKV